MNRLPRIALLTMAALTAVLVAKTGRDWKLHAAQTIPMLVIAWSLSANRIAVNITSWQAFLPLIAWPLGFSTLTMTIHLGRAGAIGEWTTQIFMLVPAFLAPAALGTRALIRLAALWSAVFIFVGGYAVIQKLGLDPVAEFRSFHSASRPFATFGNPDFLGTHCAFLFPLLLGLRDTTRNSPVRWALAGLAALDGLVLLWTGSRGAWLGALAGAGAWALLDGGALRARIAHLAARPREAVHVIATASAALVVAGWLAFPHLTRRTDRLMLWEGTGRMIAARPLAGWGPGSFAAEYTPFAPPAFAERMQEDNTFAEHPHSEYLQVATEYGIPALGLFLWALAAILARGIRAARAGVPLAAGATAALIAVLVHILVDRNFRLASTATPFWLLAGPLCAARWRTPDDPASGHPRIALDRRVGALVLATGCLWLAAFQLRPLRASLAVAAEVDFLKQAAGITSKELRDREPALGGQPAYWVELGNVYAKEENFPAAADAFRTALRLDPSVPAARNNLGNCYFMMSRFADAEREFRELLTIDPDHRDARFNLAMAYYYQRKIKDALAVVDGILRRDPANAKAIQLRQQLAP